ncbi:G-protein coupled receptor 182 isoform X2 [Genypterus blacodes]|uniref:G-protein coupled receptor 182 isoform X2 n=1 Tax=Genypterus blacodes TaxID=154954 RepID=UPI003F76FF0D
MSAEDHSNRTLEFYNQSAWFLYECTLTLSSEYRRIALFLLYLFIFVVGLLENTLVVWVNWRRRHSASGVLFCILNVSLSDLMVIIILPFFMMEATMDSVWLWGRFLCKVTNLIYVVNFYSSSFFLAFMTLERYLSLTRPSSPACFPVAGRRRWLLCGGLWSLSFFLALLENVHVEFLVPASIIVTCNVLIARAIRTTPDVQGRRDVWLVHVYSLVFLMCWLPYHLTMCLMVLDDINPFLFSCNTTEVIYFSFSVIQGFSLLHCVANPILYNFLSKSFRNNLITTVANYLPREALGTMDQLGPGANTANGGGAEPGKQRKLSNASTSHSDLES